MAESRRPFTVLRAIGVTAAAAGASGSLSFMFWAGSRQRSILLMALFAGWVLSPFVAVGWASLVSTRWPRFTGSVICMGSLVLTTASLLMYSGAIPMPEGSRPAAVFLLVPFASWLLIATGAWFLTKSLRHRAGAGVVLVYALTVLPGCGSPEATRVSQASAILEQVVRYEVQQFASAAENPSAVPVCVAVRDAGAPMDPPERVVRELSGFRGARASSTCPAGDSIRLVAGPIEWLTDSEVRVHGEYRRDPGGARPLAYRVVLENGLWRCAGPIISADPL